MIYEKIVNIQKFKNRTDKNPSGELSGFTWKYI